MARIPFTDDDAVLPTATRPSDHDERPEAGTAIRAWVVAGPDEGLALSTPQTQLLVGRATTAGLRLRDPLVSAFHVELEPAGGGGITVRDLASTNGTLYHGARITNGVVPDGAVLEVGATLVGVGLAAPSSVFAPGPAVVSESFGTIVGASRPMRELFALLSRIVSADSSVLIQGATGTGKELVARTLHHASGRSAAPFVVLDCTAIPRVLAEPILFGREAGTHGAAEARAGVVEAAATGTLLLDNVAELPLDLQVLVLRALGDRSRARVVATTTVDLRARVNQGALREDLYLRIAQSNVTLPPLAARRDDIRLLVEHFLSQLPAGAGGARTIAQDALRELERRDWPGNVRELKSTVERAALTAGGDAISTTDLAFERVLASHQSDVASAAADEIGELELPFFKEAKNTIVAEFERAYLARLLARTGGNLTRASALAGIERHHLRELVRKHGLR